MEIQECDLEVENWNPGFEEATEVSVQELGL